MQQNHTIFDRLLVQNGGSEDAALRDAMGQVIGVAIASGRLPPEVATSLFLRGAAEPTTEVGTISMLSGLGFAYVTAREEMPASLFSGGSTRQLTGPNIIVAASGQDRKDGGVTMSASLVGKRYRVISEPDEEVVARPFLDHLFNGALDHTVERAVFARTEGHDAGSLFEQAGNEGIDTVAILPGSQAGDSFAKLNDVGRRLTDEALRSGRALVLPSRTPAAWKGMSAWWEVEAATGRTVDTMEDGSHVTSVDTATQVEIRASWAARTRILGCTVAVVVGSSGAQLAEAMAVADPGAATMIVAAKALADLGKLGCRNVRITRTGRPEPMAPIPNPPVRPQPLPRPQNPGMGPVLSRFPRRPWIGPGGRRGPANF